MEIFVKEGDVNDPTSGSIPVLQVRGRGIAEMWENSMVELYHRGRRIKTEYDSDEDPPSIDATMKMVADEPFAEPMIHKAFPGGAGDLEEYRQEVCDGIKDFLIDLDDPDKWKYTYHERLAAYKAYAREVRKGREDGIHRVERTFVVIDQLKQVAEKLAGSPHSRRAYAPTGQPWIDWSIPDPPCCLGLWFRIMKDDEGYDRLNMNVTFRSRDAYDAAFMNCFAFAYLMAKVAGMISRLCGRPIMLGRYCDDSYSYHIYGKRLRGKLPNFEEGFLGMLEKRKFWDPDDIHNSRTATSLQWAPMFDEARLVISEKIRALRQEAGV